MSTAARVLARSVVQRPGLSSGLLASLTAVDQVFSDFGPFGPGKLWPPAIPATLWPNAPPDTIGRAFPVCYGEKSDEGAHDPITNEPNSKGLVPLLFIGQQILSDLDANDVEDPPAIVPDVTIAAPVIKALTKAERFDGSSSWIGATVAYAAAVIGGAVGTISSIATVGGDPGVNADTVVHIDAIDGGADSYIAWVSDNPAFHPVTNPTAGLVGVATHSGIGPSDYWYPQEVVQADYSIHVKPATAAADTWDAYLVCLGRSTRIIAIYGSDLGGGDPTKTPDRTQFSITEKNGSDLLTPWDVDGNVDAFWPFDDPWVTYTDATTGVQYDCTVIFARGPISDDHKNGVVNMAANVIGRPDSSGNPIIDAHSVQQYWLENDLILEATTGTGCNNTTAPKWEDGTYKVRSSSFTERQAFTADSIGGRGLTVGWYVDEQQSVTEWIRLWNRSTESVLGINGHGQIVVWGLDETVEPSDWDGIDHVSDLFGPVVRVSGEERENVVAGVCDWDTDSEIFRVAQILEASDVGIEKYKNRRKQGDLLESTMLNDADQLLWVIQRRLARLHLGTTLVEVTGPIGFLDRDVGDGILLTSEEGTGANGYEDHPFIIMRRRVNLAALLVTYTLWDVRDVLIATAYVNGLDRLFELTNDTDVAAVLSNDEDVAALVAA